VDTILFPYVSTVVKQWIPFFVCTVNETRLVCAYLPLWIAYVVKSQLRISLNSEHSGAGVSNVDVGVMENFILIAEVE